MSIVVWPVDAVTGAPSYTGRMLREASVAPLAGFATAARPLGARSGVRPGTPTTTVTATSTTWTCNTHAGIIDGETAAIAGPYAYAVNTAQTGSVTAANATNPRVDIVYAQVSDPAESDGSSVPSVVIAYLAGTAAPAPVAPATPARSMVLAQINVPVSGGGSPTVTWVAPTLTAAGGIIPVASSTERDALTAYEGLTVYRMDTNVLESYSGSAWQVSSLTSYGYFGTPLVGSYNPALPVKTYVIRQSGTTDTDALAVAHLPVTATSVLGASATWQSTSTSLYLFKVRTDLATTTQVAFQMHAAGGSAAVSTAYVAELRVEYQ